MSNARQERARPMTNEEWSARGFNEWAERCWGRPIGYGDWWPEKIELVIDRTGIRAMVTESRPAMTAVNRCD